MMGLKLSTTSSMLRDELDCYQQAIDRGDYIERSASTGPVLKGTVSRD